MNRFTGKTVLITGGTSGMGMATARRLITEGARVVVTGRTRQRVDDAVRHLGPNASGVVADAADLAAVDVLMETVRDRHGRLDTLFANAGTGTFLPFENITEPDFDHGVDVNFKGVFFTVQKALPLLADGGSIVINASWTLHRGNSVLTLYSATKAAVHNLARTLAAALAPRGIRVNSISPGYIDTPMYPFAALSAAEAKALTGGIAAGRFGRPEEIAATVAFLASSDASYVNGQDLVIDGGLVGAVPD
ncbi:SDR family oxidoreductase [Streptomyces sp. NA02950]|uniref:SDR family oxidoreductase n=1 Tax=Streptomyces sp. NA02950 TaxID=2742137 RepID=UPI001591229F|nr:SDR family oxidoreductase [Streptomyces sp. NA02950]QKV90507.1 SDR family oxidoreductase [Streptomyces sp. NA02950]